MEVDASQPTPVHLGAIQVQTPVILAPMAGVTDQAFRRICRDFANRGLPKGVVEASGRAGSELGAPGLVAPGLVAPGGLFVNEMVTARALVEGNESSWAMVAPDEQDPVRSIQLYGTDPQTLSSATKMLVERGLADHIDLNFGCPVPKVTRKGGGAAIPWKRDLFEDIVTSVVQAADSAAPGGAGSVPVTVKIRIGIDDDHITMFDAARIARSRGVAAVGLHARTQEQYYSGAARWPHIAQLKEMLDIPVFGNGDIFCAEDALEMMHQTGCDAVVIGRGCQGRPWLFEEITAALWGQPQPDAPNLQVVAETLMEHAALATDFDGIEARSMRELRKHVGWYLRGFAVGGAARRQLNLVSTLGELEERLFGLDLDQEFPEAAKRNRGRKGGARKPHLPHGWLDSQYLDEAEKAGLDDSDGGDGG